MNNLDKLDQPMRKQWHYHSKLPVGFYLFFEWAPQPKKWLNFIWNYGNPEIPLDFWFGSYQDDSEAATNKLQKKR